MDSISCGVQVAGENVNLDEGVDVEEISVELCDSSESAIGETSPVGGMWWSLMSCSVLADSWLWTNVNHGSELCN